MAKPLAMSGAVSNLIKPSATSTGHANPRQYHRAHAPRDDRSNTPTWNRVSNSSSSRVIASTGVASTKMMLAEYSDQMNTGRRYQARSAQSVNGDDEILSRPTTLASVFCAPSLEEIIVTVEADGLRLVLHWQIEDHTRLEVAKNRPGAKSLEDRYGRPCNYCSSQGMPSRSACRRDAGDRQIFTLDALAAQVGAMLVKHASKRSA
jgi:hypothetical protein